MPLYISFANIYPVVDLPSIVTAGGGGGFSVVVDWGVGSVELVVPSVVGGAWYIKIIVTDVKKYTKGKNNFVNIYQNI